MEVLCVILNVLGQCWEMRSLSLCNIGLWAVQLVDLRCNYEGYNLVPSCPSPKKE